ncbi:putative Calcineurin-like metallo-phosphoesterase superfamily protein [Melia azedarach]|uniref:Calcineurin-like metallo-phosphoesterase superfamily protein n=1 Tax=Melia azedarach TaxID=155640 RepID=A0ACC1XED5_MELAZ|nr:putative Calcineurin-like metallo-phosphoesterase superfamily protein [Melia azedarach]
MERNLRKPSWVCTLIVQCSLCFALYVALNLGHPQKSVNQKRNGRKSLDFNFISVTGGFRPLEQQIPLLKQMENVARSYETRFVVSTSEFGEDDPLRQNASRLFPSLKLPWYITKTSKEKEIGYFQEQIKLPHGETLDVIGIDTGSLQETNLTALSSGAGDNQLNWLTRTLEATNSHWCMVVGFHPLDVCEEQKNQVEAKQIYEHLHQMFMKFGVNAYLSKHGCIKRSHQDSVTYIENPDPFGLGNGREMVDGFLLHRVSSLEIVTYFISLEGKVKQKKVIRQRGKEAM